MVNKISHSKSDEKWLWSFFSISRCLFYSLVDIKQLKLWLKNLKENKKINDYEITEIRDYCSIKIFLNFNNIDENCYDITIEINNNVKEIIDDTPSDIIDKECEDNDTDVLIFHKPYKLQIQYYNDNKEIYDELLKILNLQKEDIFEKEDTF